MLPQPGDLLNAFEPGQKPKYVTEGSQTYNWAGLYYPLLHNRIASERGT